MNFNRLSTIVGWVVFAIAAIVYILTAEPTGSLWDCGEFITGAYKLEVVHPPGAPFFMMVGHMFTTVAQIFSDDPAMIAYSVNVMSGICTAFVAMFVCWITMIFSKLTIVGRSDEMTTGEMTAILGSGAVAGLATTFATSVWFSAVEGEVYAMASFFTALVVWAVVKWYHQPDTREADRWLVFAIFIVGLSLGVHLLSLLTLPALALLYYYKKTEVPTFKGMGIAMVTGVFIFALIIQKIVMSSTMSIGSNFDYFFVNVLGMPFNSGLLFFSLLTLALLGLGLWLMSKRGQTRLGIPVGLMCLLAAPAFDTGGALLFAALGIAAFFLIKQKIDNSKLQKILVGFSMLMLGFSTYALILIRANANTPINMNNPSNAYSLMSYLNREQYGDRPLLYGPHFAADPIGTKKPPADKIGRAGDEYDVIDKKLEYEYHPSDMMLFPRIGHYDRKAEHRRWMSDRPDSNKKPNFVNNISFLLRYQIGWMYGRYFMWNFVGRQNGQQGYYNWDPKTGNWLSGISLVDSNRLYDQSNIPDTMKNDQSRNTYFFLPFIFGLLGLFYHFNTRKWDAFAVLLLFLMTGLAIIFYSNQPPNEPRERDYVLAGSMFTYCIWIGMAVMALFDMLKRYMAGNIAAIVGAALVLTAPLIMGFQNWDDHTRAKHTGARDYASNFLESCDKNAIVFTHGDNDTYPLWYAQEVENIRTDVRVVNLSLLAVDWYIDQLRRKVNDSPPIKMSLPPEAYRGNKRNVTFLNPKQVASDKKWMVQDVMKFVAKDQQGLPPESPSYIPTSNIVIPVNKAKVMSNGTVTEPDTGQIVTEIPIRFPKNKQRLIKDELAMMDIISSNNWERPIYYAVTCRPEKLLGLSDYLQLEGLASRIVPIKTKGDAEFGSMPIGQGRVDADRMYDNIMNKFRWGNFDKEKAYINESYMPSVASNRFAMLRLARTLIAEGDKERAKNILNKYFEVFPHKNFAYDYNAMYMIRLYEDAGAEADGKAHILILAREAADQMEFLDSLDEETLQTVFRDDFQQWAGIMRELQEMVNRNPNYGDIKDEVLDLFKDFPLSSEPLRD